MRPRPGASRHTPGHQEALDRRLAMLEAELTAPGSAVRAGAAREEMAREEMAREGADEEQTPVRPALRVLPGPPAPPDDGPEQPRPAPMSPPVLPVPGRHAAPRGTRSRRWSVRRGLAVIDGSSGDRGRWAMGSSQLLVVVLVVAVGIALTAWWVIRSEPTPMPPVGTLSPAAPLVPVPSGGMAAKEAPGAVVPGGAPSVAAGAAEAAGEVVVHVAGKVRRPGLVVLPPGARVADALEAAGGPRGGADLTALNLARLLVDGEQVLVGVPTPAGSPTGTGSVAPPGAMSAGPLASELVDLNSADQALLETLPGVGPVTATAIIDWRIEHGGFTSVEELLEVDGIGDATLADLAPLVTV